MQNMNGCAQQNRSALILIARFELVILLARSPAKPFRTSSEQFQRSANRNPYPVRTIVQFVRDLVESLLQQIRVEEKAELFTIRRQMRGRSRFLEVRAQESGAHPPLPEAASCLERAHILGTNHRAFRLAIDHGVRRVM